MCRIKVRAVTWQKERSLAAQSYTLCPEATKVHCGRRGSCSLTQVIRLFLTTICSKCKQPCIRPQKLSAIDHHCDVIGGDRFFGLELKNGDEEMF